MRSPGFLIRGDFVSDGGSGAVKLRVAGRRAKAAATGGAVAAGTTAVCQGGRWRVVGLTLSTTGEDEPVRGWEWDRARWVRASVLFQLLTGYGPPLADHAVAVRLRGAQVVGRLNVGGWKLRCPLELYQCYLGYRLDLAQAEAPNISLRGSYLRSRLSARLLQVVHTLNLADFRCDGGVVLRDARINGLLNCVGAIFTNPDGQALNAVGLTADAGMSLEKAQCTGERR